ncbi:MAG: translation initiation factor IF-2 subunit gamma [Candidatus Peribacteraceae bacterium]|nr:translation initiation factor IF-2 subunit gamma [Candidatus Peribacteraceae bacterium]
MITIAEKKAEKTKKAKNIDKRLIPEFNIGMIGHVDHGKTTLTETFTGKWTDTHSEEIKRGISIRLGYADATIYKCPKCKGTSAYSTTDKCIKCFSQCEPVRTISFVDAPGHETLMATVLSGSSLMDGALLLVSASEDCPQPQTSEHLSAIGISGIEKIIIVQTKIDTVSKEKALENYKQIKEFVKGTIAENAPIIPISARQNVNMDVLIETIETVMKTPKRDPTKMPKFLIARSFDINMPGTMISNLGGGVLGGSLMQGQLKVGDEIEIKPGLKIKDKYETVRTKITGLQKAGKNMKEIEPGGLIGVSTALDPYLTKSDSLSGSIASHAGKLPDISQNIRLKTSLLKQIVVASESTGASNIKTGDMLMLTLGTMRTTGSVSSGRSEEIDVSLKSPLCVDKGDRIAISKLFSGRWRLIGYGEIT